MIPAPFFSGLGSLGWWRFSFVVAGVLVWTSSHDWAESARHFGYEIWPLLTILGMLAISPIVALADAGIAWGRYREGKDLDRNQFSWRIAWAFALLANFVAVVVVILLSEQ